MGLAIDVLVNTHANGDHTFGNSLVAGARVVASSAAAEEMRATPPAYRDFDGEAPVDTLPLLGLMAELAASP